MYEEGNTVAQIPFLSQFRDRFRYTTNDSECVSPVDKWESGSSTRHHSLIGDRLQSMAIGCSPKVYLAYLDQPYSF